MRANLPWLKYNVARGLKKLGIERNGLKKKLLNEGRTRWLDMGSRRFEAGFMCLDLESGENLAPDLAERYYAANIGQLGESDREKLGSFDLVRLQHVFEHFSFEEGTELLRFCAGLLKPDGYLLITVPDLRIHINGYFTHYRHMGYFINYAQRRIPQDAPASFLFSFHAHQFGHAPVDDPGQVHKWSYDYEGLAYQLQKVNKFKNIRRLDLLDPWASTPFTHNMPLEDLCVIAQNNSAENDPVRNNPMENRGEDL